MNSDGQSALDGLADDSKEDICVGTQLSAADHRPHHQSDCAALLGVNHSPLHRADGFAFLLT